MSDKFGCCQSCAYLDTDACDACEDADLFEPAEELAEEDEDMRQAA